MNTQAKILIVDDDEAITGLLREVLEAEGFARMSAFRAKGRSMPCQAMISTSCFSTS